LVYIVDPRWVKISKHLIKLGFAFKIYFILHLTLYTYISARYQWNYKQAVGIMEYLKITTRSDITFAVSQVARFSNNPNRSHEKALIRIARYLKGTSDKGLFINPTTDSFLECYCDADFCGLRQVTDPEDPKSVHSRTGFVIVYAGVPLFWCSKLQTHIALSTVEAEYLALSHSAREIIPTQELLREIAQSFNFHIPRHKVIAIYMKTTMVPWNWQLRQRCGRARNISVHDTTILELMYKMEA